MITSDNSMLVVIDFQPEHIASVNSIDKALLISNGISVAKLARIYNLPAVLTTANVVMGKHKGVIPGLSTELFGAEIIDRSAINAWDDDAFREAIASKKRNKLIVIGLWLETDVTFPVIEALKAGYEVYIVVDAVGGTSTLAHDAALRRLEQAGAKPTSVVQLTLELQYDWTNESTASATIGVLRNSGVFLKLD